MSTATMRARLAALVWTMAALAAAGGPSRAADVPLPPSFPARDQALLVEAESFAQCGGWVVDPQFMDQMGSPYLLAHGLGRPVADAFTDVELPAPGSYRVWVRTKDWVAAWKAPGAPGRFQLLVDGRAVGTVFGTEGALWHWQDGGLVNVARRQVRLALHDLTGFEGRCDAILFARDPHFIPPNRDPEMAAFRRACLALPEQPGAAGPFDLVVTGGGIAGTCAALAAARLGVSVALVQDRPVLGGNNSSEVRVWLQGARNKEPWPRIGDVVAELEQPRRAHYGPSNTAELYQDGQKLDVVRAEPNIRLFLEHRVVAAQCGGGQLSAVVAQHIRSGRRVRIGGRWMADCTGDAAVGVLAGADFEIQPKGHMGPCNLWNVCECRDTNAINTAVDAAAGPQPFPRCPWALDLSDKPFPGRSRTRPDTDQLGGWYWESGFDRDPIAEMEAIRDWNFRAMYGAWDAMKNVDHVLPNHRLNWAAYILGKRESRRLLGDVVLGVDDLLQDRQFPDGCAPTGWSNDLHLPDPRYEKGFEGDAFISTAHFGSFPAIRQRRPFWIPYRCLYSRNVANLFMAGRDISTRHDALGAVRVMRTGGCMGEIVGMAASLCKKHEAQPRDIYQNYLDELQELMRRGVGKLPGVQLAYENGGEPPLKPAAKAVAKPAAKAAPSAPTAPSSSSAAMPHSVAELWADFDPRRDPLQTELVRQWTADGMTLRYVRFLIGTFKGRPARMAAFYGFPEGARGKLPAVMHIHGGGQRASLDEVRAMVARGYAALSLNWGGAGGGQTHINLMQPSQPGDPNTDWGAVDPTQLNAAHYSSILPGPKQFFDDRPHPKNCNWYLLTLACRRGLTFLEQQPEVDPQRLGIHGYSMGGNLTMYVAGSDPRVKAAVPGVGGQGWRWQPYAFAGGAAQAEHIQGDVDVFRRTLSFESYAPLIHCPLLHRSATNDFHGWMDDVYRTDALIQGQPVRHAWSPHFNHRLTPEVAVTMPLWLDHVLQGGPALPETPESRLLLATDDGCPQLRVTPHSTWPVARCDVYYSIDPDPRARFWRSAEVARSGETFSARLPLETAEQPLFAMANVFYTLPQPVRMPQLPELRNLAIGEVCLSSQLHAAQPDALRAAGVRVAGGPSRLIDDFAHGWRDWYRLNVGNRDHWENWSRKISDPQWRGPAGARLAVALRLAETNRMAFVVVENEWRSYRGPRRTFVCQREIPGAAAEQTIVLALDDFKDTAGGGSLKSWAQLDLLGLCAHYEAKGPPAGQSGWHGTVPEFRRLQWQ